MLEKELKCAVFGLKRAKIGLFWGYLALKSGLFGLKKNKNILEKCQSKIIGFYRGKYWFYLDLSIQNRISKGVEPIL